MAFGDLLKKFREKRDLSQTELAAKTGLKQQSIARWELNLNDPPWAAVQAIAAALEVSTEALADRPATAGKKGKR